MAPGTHSTHFHSQAEPYTRRGPEAGEASGFGARYTDGHPQSQWPTTEAPLACSRSAGAPSKSPASSRSRTLRSPVSSGRAPPAIRTVCRPWHRTHIGISGRVKRPRKLQRGCLGRGHFPATGSLCSESAGGGRPQCRTRDLLHIINARHGAQSQAMLGALPQVSKPTADELAAGLALQMPLRGRNGQRLRVRIMCVTWSGLHVWP